MTDDRRSAPHVARNAAPISEVLREILPARGLVLELASGSGEHSLHFARVFPELRWQPSDPEPAALRSIEAWRAESGLANLLPPIPLDVGSRKPRQALIATAASTADPPRFRMSSPAMVA